VRRCTAAGHKLSDGAYAAYARRATDRLGAESHWRATAQTYNDLAMAFARRARETSNTEFYERAHQALADCFRLAPKHWEGRKTKVWVLLGQHEFARALEEAKALNRQMPDDLIVYALLVDCHVELGNYADAEVAGQWLLDLRPGHVAGLTRGAYLREVFGDLEGALDFMSQAFERTPPSETEDRAWLLTHIAHLQRLSGRLREGEIVLGEALRLFTNYHYALAELAKLRLDQQRYEEAVSLLRQRYELASHPENLYELASALQRAGKRDEAHNTFQQFEIAAKAESAGWDNANRELIYYYVDHARKPKEALRLAEQEIARRKDIHTRGAYAWALFANQRSSEALEQLEKALAVGTREPLLLEHARRIGLARKDQQPSGLSRSKRE
jgi:tetratricopeptide (TPR) repeat protein